MLNIWSAAKTKRQRKKLYISLLPEIREIARASGYAIGVHGSMTRDLDLIAAPWVKNAVKPATLAYRIHRGVSKYYYSPKDLAAKRTVKPRGRVAYDLIIGPGGAYIDLSIY